MSIYDIFLISASRLKLTLDQFLTYSPGELLSVLHYWMKDERSRVELEWERSRVQTFFLVNVQLAKGSKMDYRKFCREFWPFPWEKKEITIEDNSFGPSEWNQLLNKKVEKTRAVGANETVQT